LARSLLDEEVEPDESGSEEDDALEEDDEEIGDRFLRFFLSDLSLSTLSRVRFREAFF